jgi:hypothetical protein
MNHIDAPGLNLSAAIIALMNNSSGSIEEIVREVLVGASCFLQNQGEESDCGGLNASDGFAYAARDEYVEVLKLRKFFDKDK